MNLTVTSAQELTGTFLVLPGGAAKGSVVLLSLLTPE